MKWLKDRPFKRLSFENESQEDQNKQVMKISIPKDLFLEMNGEY